VGTRDRRQAWPTADASAPAQGRYNTCYSEEPQVQGADGLLMTLSGDQGHHRPQSHFEVAALAG
jgi:hypothetical protein